MEFLANHAIFTIAAITFIVTFAIHFTFGYLSEKWNVYRITSDNKRVPKFVGGVLSLAFIISIMTIYFSKDYFNIVLEARYVVEVCIGIGAFFALGYYFDNKQIVGKKKIILELIVLSALALFTQNTNFIELNLENYTDVINYTLNFILEVIWYMVVVNGMNLLRKVDMLVSGISLISSLAFFVIALTISHIQLTVYSVMLVAIATYLTLTNTHVNNIIGLTFGYILAYLGATFLMKGPALVITGILAFALPIFNVVYILYKRLARGTIITIRDDEHVFHKMKQKGYSNVRILGIMYIVSFTIVTISYVAIKVENPYIFILAILVIAFFGIRLENTPTKKGKIKVMSIFGTRPEAIKMAPVIKALENEDEIDSVVCVTGQHKEMLYQVLDSLEIYPRYDLNIMRNRQTLVGISSRILKVLEKVVKREKPDLILVHGDTTSTFVAGFLGYYMGVEVGHVEAGLRTFNRKEPFPEEMNRVLTGALASLHFSPSKVARQNLLNEGISEENIFLTGNTAVDSTRLTYKDDYKFKEQIINTVDFSKNRVIVMTAHRRENLGEPLKNICKAVKRLVTDNQDVVVIYAVHKNPAVREVVYSILKGMDRVLLVEPLDVTDMHNLMKRSYLMLTDSGGLQEEAPSFNLPTIVLRNVTERPEGLETGILKLAGTDEETIYSLASEILRSKSEHDKMANSKNPYGDGFAANRIVEAIKYKFDITNERPQDFLFDQESNHLARKKEIKSTEILGVRIDKVTMDEAVEKIFEFFEEDKLHIVHTTNPEFILTAQNDEEYKTILNSASLAVPDGIGAVIASKYTDVRLEERVPGYELALNLMHKMQGTDYSVYILGAKKERLEKAIANLKDQYPKLKIAGYHDGYFKDENDEEIINDINASGATLLLIAMGGNIKQEKWIWKYKDRIKARVSIGVGGSVDVISGEVKRAPKIFQKLNLEWLYRTLSEPKKRIPRVYRLPYFLLLAAKDSKKKEKQKNK